MSEPSRNTASGLHEQVRHIVVDKTLTFRPNLIKQQRLYHCTRVGTIWAATSISESLLYLTLF